jgi:hypothetical protein
VRWDGTLELCSIGRPQPRTGGRPPRIRGGRPPEPVQEAIASLSKGRLITRRDNTPVCQIPKAASYAVGSTCAVSIDCNGTARSRPFGFRRANYGTNALHDHEVSDVFGPRGRELLRQRFALLPPHTAFASQQLLEQIGSLDRHVGELEQRIRATFKPTPPIQRLLTVPGIGLTLAVVIALEVGEVRRFGRPRSSQATRARPPVSMRAAGRCASGRLAPTSTTISNGHSSRRRTRSA